METLPRDVLIKTILELPVNNITKLCQTSKRINDLICESDEFWRLKLYHDFKIRWQAGNEDPKSTYQNILKRIKSNREYCLKLQKRSNFATVGFSDIFLYNLTQFENFNDLFPDDMIFNYLADKFLLKDYYKTSIGTYDRYISKFKDRYNNRLVRGSQFVPSEMEVLKEILLRFRQLTTDKELDINKRNFLVSYIDSLLRGNVPFEAKIKDLCKYNIF